MVRCKLQLTGIQEFANMESKEYTLTAQYDSSIPEDIRFAKSSPNGSFKIYVNNPPAQEQFVLGQHYYFDAAPVPAA
jgi:hypothetical protein